MKLPEMPTPGEIVRISPLSRRLTQDNPSVFTGIGTNTYLVGDQRLFLLDPGPLNDEHFENIVAAVGDSKVLGVVPTHHHPDHWPLAPQLAEHFGCTTMGHQEIGDWQPQSLIADGQILDPEGLRLEAILTPGHAPDHLCFFFHPENVLFSGDHVMGWSTSVIAPPGGNLNAYMESLDRLLSRTGDRMLPAHGLPIDDPTGRITDLTRHRRSRTEQALATLDSGPLEVSEMVRRIYADVDPKLHIAAAWSLLAHLLALEEEGQLQRQHVAEDPIEDTWQLAAGDQKSP